MNRDVRMETKVEQGVTDGNRETILGCKDNRDRGTELHRKSSRRRMKSDTVSENTHDVVTVYDFKMIS